jgi:hypothetical protein
MAVRRPTSRTSTNHIFVEYNGQRFMLESGAFQTKSIIYRVKKKLLSGKLSIPNLGEKRGVRTILITCSTGKNGLVFSWL